MPHEVYYRQFFPFQDLHRFLCGGKSDDDCRVFARREFSFTFANDVYSRFRSYDSWEQWKQDAVRCLPAKIDIGAVYQARVAHPKRDPAAKNVFQEKEFVIDIDMPDTKSITTECKDPAHPDYAKSWRFMRIAVEAIDRRLRADLGFEHVLWVFSGRKVVVVVPCRQKKVELTHIAGRAGLGRGPARARHGRRGNPLLCVAPKKGVVTREQARTAVARYLAVDVADMVRSASHGPAGFSEVRRFVKKKKKGFV